MKPLKWDGRERTADRLMDLMPDLTISTTGGAPGYPRELAIHDRKGRRICNVQRGQYVGKNAKGDPFIDTGH